MSAVATNIKSLRQKFSLTQEQLGKIAGVSDKAVSTWENGVAEPRIGAVRKMADHFGISITEILVSKDSIPDGECLNKGSEPIRENPRLTVLINKISSLSSEELDLVEKYISELISKR